MDNQLLFLLLFLALALLLLGTGFRYYQKPAAPVELPAFIRELTVEPPGNLKLASTHHEEEDLGSGKTKHVQHMRLIAYDRGAGLRRCTNIAQTNQGGDLPIQLREAFDLDITDRLVGNKPAIRFGKGQSHVNITPLGTNRVNVTNPDPATWFYRNAWNNCDYRLIVANHKLDKAILLRAGHPSQFAFELSHAGLDLATLATPDFRILQPSLEKDGETIPLEWLVSAQGGKTILTVVLPPGNWAGWTVDPTLVLQPDATDGKDTIIISAVTNNNLGTYDTLLIGDPTTGPNKCRSLIQPSLSELPDNALISSATYALYATARSTTNNRTYRVYRLKRAWVEGTRNNADDTPATGATWIRYDTTNTWGAAGGFDGTDCEQTEIGSRAFTTTESLDEFKEFPLAVATKAALDLGYGHLFKADTETDDRYSFPSSDNATPANRPTLTIVYTLPATGMVRSPMWGRF